MNLSDGDVLASVALLHEDRRAEREKAIDAENDRLAAASAYQGELPGFTEDAPPEDGQA